MLDESLLSMNSLKANINFENDDDYGSEISFNYIFNQTNSQNSEQELKDKQFEPFEKKLEDQYKKESSEKESYYSTSKQSSTHFTNKKLTKKRKNPHNRFTSDNLLRKVQVHYLTFLISFLNFLLKYFNYEYKFLKLDYSIKKNINKDVDKRKIEIGNGDKTIINCFDDDTVEKIISQNISKQYKQYNENQNKFICEAVKRNAIMNNILKDNHLNIFKKFYFTSSKLINLKEYGLDNCIKLPNNIKTHIDLLKKNESFGEKYKKCINEVILKTFFKRAKFLFY
jgi:hypothetical protein